MLPSYVAGALNDLTEMYLCFLVAPSLLSLFPVHLLTGGVVSRERRPSVVAWRVLTPVQYK